jgi:hypothetical protein
MIVRFTDKGDYWVYDRREQHPDRAGCRYSSSGCSFPPHQLGFCRQL